MENSKIRSALKGVDGVKSVKLKKLYTGEPYFECAVSAPCKKVSFTRSYFETFPVERAVQQLGDVLKVAHCGVGDRPANG